MRRACHHKSDSTRRIPWNYPIQMWYVEYSWRTQKSVVLIGPRAWKVAPALAVGCTIVMKPSEITPLTALVRRSEWPPPLIVF